MLDRGVHPIQIADGFERACNVAVSHLEGICDLIPFGKGDTDLLMRTARTCLGSKMYVKWWIVDPSCI